MKLLKIISFFFIVYFIRRFFQMYSVMKEIQKKQAQEPKVQQGQIFDADFKVVER